MKSSPAAPERAITRERLTLPTGGVGLQATFSLPDAPRALVLIVLIVHGCHPGAACPRDHVLAATLHEVGIATVMTDLLTLVTRNDEQMLRYATQAVRSAPGTAELRVFHAPTPSPPVEPARGDHVARWFQRHLTPAPSAVASGPFTMPSAPILHIQETPHAH